MTSDMQNSSPSNADNSTGENPGEATKGSGLPVRGLAMILIAVAVLLAAWAVWSMTSDSDDSATGTDTAQTQDANAPAPQNDNTQANPDGAAGAQPGEPGGRPEEGAPAAEGTEGQGAEGEAARAGTDAEGADAEGSDAEKSEQAAATPARPGRPAAGGTPVSTLHVLNNSTVPQLAARVADSLDRDYENVESGNLPDMVIPNTTVYFTPGNPEAEKAARELADRVGGIAMERTEVLPRETAGDDAIVLVLTGDIEL